MSDQVQIHMTAAEYRNLPETTQPAELIEGEYIVSPAPKHPHQRRVFRLAKFLDAVAPGGEVVISPMDVYLDETNVPQPDVFWVSGDESLCHLGDDGYWHGAPDLVVEVLSPSTAHVDRSTKFRLYEKFGVREYWLLDPEGRYIEPWQRIEGRFIRQGAFGIHETFESPVLGGHMVDVKAIFED